MANGRTARLDRLEPPPPLATIDPEEADAVHLAGGSGVLGLLGPAAKRTKRAVVVHGLGIVA
jgi:hypothetical protein